MNKLLSCALVLLLSLNAFAALAPDIYLDGEAAPVKVSIGRMVKPPALDGVLSEWPEDATSILLGQNSQTGRRFRWEGTGDFCGSVRLAWDETYLYLAADVRDDRLCQAASGAEVWQGDTLELFFNTHPGQQRTDGFYQQAIVPPLKPDAKLFTAGPPKSFENVEGTTQVRANGYTLECRIPWVNLAGFVPAVGTGLGFQVYLDDRDGNARKTQLLWYPSAISFAQPTHTNVIILSERGQCSLPRVLAGTNNWCVTDADTMAVSAVADLPGAKSAKITATPPYPDPAHVPAPISFDMVLAGERISVGRGIMSVKGCEGLYGFTVSVMDEQGRKLAENTFQAQLVGAKFQRMRGLYDNLKKRVEAGRKRDDLDPVIREGVAAWFARVGAFVSNEARPEALNHALLEQMLTEFGDIGQAVTAMEKGGDPYAGRTGSFVRAYRSPLTLQFRPYALIVPQTYDAESGKGLPLIVLLHSIFADERMLSLMAETFKDLGAIVYQGASYRQFDWGGVSAAETWVALDEVKRLYHVDEERQYLTGYHIGGRGTWQLAMARPDLWAAVAPVFSGIDTSPNYPALRLYPEYYGKAIDVRIPNHKVRERPEPITDPLERKLFEQASLVSRLDNIMHVPMRSAFGEDNPDAAAERLAMQKRLGDSGVSLNTHYVPGAMHGSPAEEFRDPSFYRWLLSNKRQPYPKQVRFTTSNLRDNSAWWVSVEQLSSPAEIATVNAEIDNRDVTVTTGNAGAISLILDKRLAPAGTKLSITVDGQPQITATASDAPTALNLVRTDGKWAVGSVPATQKHHTVSGPIDDFQRDRFMFVYGTGGDEAQKAAMEKRGKRMADWGLGATFTVKADAEVTEADIRDAHLLLIGTPSNNRLIARMADRLPLKWTETGIALGELSVDGSGAGACIAVPNPLSPGRYAVIITSFDDLGYQIWDRRNPGGDYVLGRAEPKSDKPGLELVARGWFTNDWKWSADLCVRY